MVKGGIRMRFESGKEMLDCIYDTDLYNAEKEIYVFQYNEVGSIACYNISNKEAEKLRELSKENDGEYWGAFLGIGGYIYDDPEYDGFEEGDYSNLDWCNDNFEGEWEDASV